MQSAQEGKGYALFAQRWMGPQPLSSLRTPPMSGKAALLGACGGRVRNGSGVSLSSRRGAGSSRESEMLESWASYPAFSEPPTLHLPNEVNDSPGVGVGAGKEGTGDCVNDSLLSHGGK